MKTPASAFKSQKDRARERGIAFKFTFEEWVAWWELNLGPDWFQKRGRHRHQYVMARESDLGDYSKDNVKCITMADNLHERPANGTSPIGRRNGATVLSNKQVTGIYLASGSQETIAKRFGTNRHRVASIKSKRHWAHLTNKLDVPCA